MGKQHRQQTESSRTVPKGVWVRFALLGAIWLWLCGLVVVSRPLNFFTIFVIVASGIVVFVPMYKKYVRGNGSSKTSGGAGK